jgi:hypothetical protein
VCAESMASPTYLQSTRATQNVPKGHLKGVFMTKADSFAPNQASSMAYFNDSQHYPSYGRMCHLSELEL